MSIYPRWLGFCNSENEGSVGYISELALSIEMSPISLKVEIETVELLFDCIIGEIKFNLIDKMVDFSTRKC